MIQTQQGSGFSRKLHTATQFMPDAACIFARFRRTRAFEEWRQRLRKTDRLPRGRYFEGKAPGASRIVMDEFWKAAGSLF